MSHNDIELKDKKGSIHDLTVFAISKNVVKDFPIVLMIFDSMLKLLYPYCHYAGVSLVVSAIEDSKVLMISQLNDSKRVVKRKARSRNE